MNRVNELQCRALCIVNLKRHFGTSSVMLITRTPLVDEHTQKEMIKQRWGNFVGFFPKNFLFFFSYKVINNYKNIFKTE